MHSFFSKISVVLLGVITMVAFAANSVFCRLALTSDEISPVAFTGLRIFSGALVLLPIALWNRRNFLPFSRHSLFASISLFAYALFFSLAYVRLNTGAGALILFATVQLTMVGTTIAQGNQITKSELAGVILAMAGLTYMLLPGAEGPSWDGALLMILSGGSWGIYSILGKQEKFPVFATSRNFLLASSLGLILLWVEGSSLHLGSEGAKIAMLSGALTSGLGYVLWYLLLRHIVITVASVLQLSVPLIAAFGGVLFVGEEIEFRLIVSSIVILGGILLTIFGKKGRKLEAEK